MGGLIGVDPGINGTGIALFSREKLYPEKVINLCPSRVKEWGVRAKELCTDFENFLYTNRPGEMYIELPVFMPSTRRGMMTARNGDLVKLSLLTGMLYILASSNGCEVITVEPIEWKGTKSKEAGYAMVRAILPNLHEYGSGHKIFTGHELDAIGIALYGKGMIQRGYRKRGRV